MMQNGQKGIVILWHRAARGNRNLENVSCFIVSFRFFFFFFIVVVFEGKL